MSGTTIIFGLFPTKPSLSTVLSRGRPRATMPPTVEGARPRSWLRRCALGPAVVTLAGASIVTLMLLFAGSQEPPLRVFAIALVFALLIGPPAWIALPWIWERLSPWGKTVQRAGLVSGLLVIAVGGCFMASGLVVAVGLLSPAAYG